MLSKRKHLPLFVVVVPPLVGVIIGATFASLFPPQHPGDRMFAWIVAAGGLGAIGLLFGFLAGLFLRARITPLIAICALVVPVSALGWLINGKGGRSNIAWWFGLAGLIAATIFLVRSLNLIANHDGDARDG